MQEAAYANSDGTSRLSSTFYNHANQLDNAVQRELDAMFKYEKDSSLKQKRKMYLIRFLAGKHCSALLSAGSGAGARALNAVATPGRSAELAAERATALTLKMFDGLLSTIEFLGTGIGNGQQSNARKAIRRCGTRVMGTCMLHILLWGVIHYCGYVTSHTSDSFVHVNVGCSSWGF